MHNFYAEIVNPQTGKILYITPNLKQALRSQPLTPEPASWPCSELACGITVRRKLNTD
jgi:hypothetical protein